MGGGTRAASTLYGSKRKVQVSLKAINRTGRKYGVDLQLDKKGTPNIRVLSDKQWRAEGHSIWTLAFFRKHEGVNGTIHVRRKYFAGRKMQGVMTHELGHHFAGDKVYFKGLGRDLEEGMVEYLTQGSRVFGFLGRGARFTGGIDTYQKEVTDVGSLMGVVGRRKFIRLWRDGFDAVQNTPRVKKWTNAVINGERERSRLQNLYDKKSQETYDKYLKKKEKLGYGWNLTPKQIVEHSKMQTQVDKKMDALRFDKTKAIAKLKIGHKMSQLERAKDDSKGYALLSTELKKKGYKETADFVKRSYRTRHNVRRKDLRDIMREDELKYNLDKFRYVPPQNLKSIRTGETIE